MAIGRKLLVAVWQVLSEEVAYRFADPRDVASSFLRYAYRVDVRNLPGEQPVLAFTRDQLDRLGGGISHERTKNDYWTELRHYEASGCNNYPLKPECTRAKLNRHLRISFRL